jgi:hypothetical protein
MSAVQIPAQATVPVVIWNKADKHIEECPVSMHTTFQDVLDALELRGVQSALVGRRDVPFKLMPGDFDPDDTYDGGPAASSADTFGHKIVNIVLWMAYLEDRDPGMSMKDVRARLAQVYEHEEALVEVLAGHAIHVFMYNHQMHDCSYGEEGFWSKRNPEMTTAKSTLWLRLEKEFRQNEACWYESDWTHATVTGVRPPGAHAWIHESDARYKELRADMWKDLRLRLRFERIVDVLTAIDTCLQAKVRSKETASLAMRALVVEMSGLFRQIELLYATLPDSGALMREDRSTTMIDAGYTEQRQAVLDTHKSLQELVLQARDRLQALWIDRGLIAFSNVVLIEDENVVPSGRPFLNTEEDWWDELCRLLPARSVAYGKDMKGMNLSALLEELRRCNV